MWGIIAAAIIGGSHSVNQKYPQFLNFRWNAKVTMKGHNIGEEWELTQQQIKMITVGPQRHFVPYHFVIRLMQCYRNLTLVYVN